MAKVFISYCHKQGDWVWDRLVPCLKAGGAEVLIDRDGFDAGKAVIGQMDSVQDQAEVHLLMLSPEYLASKYCTHEMKRAINKDPEFDEGAVIPVMLSDCKLPNRIKRPNPIYVDLRDDCDNEPWYKLLAGCQVDLGADATHWLQVRDELRSDLQLGRSVNLVVSGRDVAWRGLIDHLAEDTPTKMTRVDLYSARTIQRPGLLACMLSEDEGVHNLPSAPQDLTEFQRIVEERPSASYVVLMHFDQVQHRDYGTDYFATLRYLVTEQRKLVLLVQSRGPFVTLLPNDAEGTISSLAMATRELRGRK